MGGEGQGAWRRRAGSARRRPSAFPALLLCNVGQAVPRRLGQISVLRRPSAEPVHKLKKSRA